MLLWGAVQQPWILYSPSTTTTDLTSDVCVRFAAWLDHSSPVTSLVERRTAPARFSTGYFTRSCVLSGIIRRI